MTPTEVGIIGLVALFVLLALRMPVGIAMSVVCTVGYGVLKSWPETLAQLIRDYFG